MKFAGSNPAGGTNYKYFNNIVNIEKLYAIAKPRDEKAYKEFMLRYKYRFFIRIWQKLQLLWYKL